MNLKYSIYHPLFHMGSFRKRHRPTGDSLWNKQILCYATSLMDERKRKYGYIHI